MWRTLKSFCGALSLDCREASRAQSELLDHSLPAARRVGLWLHLFLCEWCRRYGRQLRFLREAARHRGDQLAEAAPVALSTAARERIKRRLVNNK